MRETLTNVRQLMTDIEALIIPSSDSHYSEYVADHFKTRAFISGFTGSAGTVVIMKESAGLWTDGRYYTQAEIELKESGIDLFKAAELNVKPYDVYLRDSLKEGSKVGINGDLFTASQVKKMQKTFNEKGIELVTNIDYANDIWLDRPALRSSEVFSLTPDYQGDSITGKLNRLRENMKDKKASAMIVSNLDSVAWLFNIRANDIDFFPVAYGFGFVTNTSAVLFIDQSRVSKDSIEQLHKNGVEVKDYDLAYDYITSVESEEQVLCDLSSLNYNLYHCALNNENFKIVESSDLIDDIKTIKNNVEIINMKDAYLKDCTALAEFWSGILAELDNNQTLNEFELLERLAKIRKTQDGCISESFGAIIAHDGNAAMMHYAPSKNKSASFTNSGTLLVDSGGQYQNGTTDITRTFALGQVSDLVKRDFTLALKGIIALQEAVVLEGATAADLDILCRQPLWKEGIDYKCGTGHGVGYVSTVHEGKVNFRYNTRQRHIEPGMMLTIEPGVYREGVHGIRTENTVVVKTKSETEFGKFFSFENICFFPIDLNLIDKELLSDEEISYINDYHKDVFAKLSSRVSQKALIWLKEKCRAL